MWVLIPWLKKAALKIWNLENEEFRIDLQISRDLLNNFKFSISNYLCLGTTCTTTVDKNSPDPNKPCIFPFKSWGKTYYECIENDQKTFLFCKTNSEGTKWGKCGEVWTNVLCPGGLLKHKLL